MLPNKEKGSESRARYVPVDSSNISGFWVWSRKSVRGGPDCSFGFDPAACHIGWEPHDKGDRFFIQMDSQGGTDFTSCTAVEPTIEGADMLPVLHDGVWCWVICAENPQ